MKANISTKKIVTISLLCAVSVILRLLGFPQSGTFRIELGFIPIALTGAVFGPVWGGVSYLLADLIGTLCTGQLPAPTITACKVLMGVIFGICFYKKNPIKPSRIIVCVAIITLLIDLLLMPLALVPIMGGKSYIVILGNRLWASLATVPIRIVGITLTFKYLKDYITKED